MNWLETIGYNTAVLLRKNGAFQKKQEIKAKKTHCRRFNYHLSILLFTFRPLSHFISFLFDIIIYRILVEIHPHLLHLLMNPSYIISIVLISFFASLSICRFVHSIFCLFVFHSHWHPVGSHKEGITPIDFSAGFWPIYQRILSKIRGLHRNTYSNIWISAKGEECP